MLIEVLGLNNPTTVEFRQRVLRLVEVGTADLVLQWFGYPVDLPDLAGLKPTSNARVAGVSTCAYALRQAKKLPELLK